MSSNAHNPSENTSNRDQSYGIQNIVARLSAKLKSDEFIQNVVSGIRRSLDVDRVALYYFATQWKGRVTFESLSHESYSIFGMTGADDCFNEEYAELYQAGRYRAIEDIESEPIHNCHRDFLRSIQVKSNLVVPILTPKGLWGLFAAHHCQAIRAWSSADIKLMKNEADRLSTSPIIHESTLQ